MNTEKSKTSEPYTLKLDLKDKLNLKNRNKNMTLANLSIFYTWKNIKSEYNNNKFKISAPIWNKTFDLPGGYYSVADIQDYLNSSSKNIKIWPRIYQFKFIQKKVKNRIVFKKKTGYKLELLTPEMMKLLISTKKDVDKDTKIR